MNVTFYSIDFDRNHVVKALPAGQVVSCNLLYPADLHDPMLRLEHDASSMTYNYAYIPDFGRYYYVDPPELEGKEDIFSLHVDVLMSFSTDIKNSPCIATRSNKGNDDIPDPMILEIPSEKIMYRKLSTAITGGTYVAILGGK